jgi:hypothetical protein
MYKLMYKASTFDDFPVWQSRLEIGDYLKAREEQPCNNADTCHGK